MLNLSVSTSSTDPTPESLFTPRFSLLSDQPLTAYAEAVNVDNFDTDPRARARAQEASRMCAGAQRKATRDTSNERGIPPPQRTTVRRTSILSHASTSETQNPMSPPAASLKEIQHADGDDGGCSSSEKAIAMRNESTYRKQVSLEHEFHELLTLPLWDPSPIEIGAVGYLSKPAGQFCPLFNSMSPTKSDKIEIKALPPLGKDGDVTIGIDRSDTRTLTHKVYDLVSGPRTVRRLLSTFSMGALPKRQTYRLKAGKAAAYMYAEVTEHHYFEDLSPPRKWFQDNIDKILAVYESHPEVKKETLMLITGALQTPRYGLFVSHSHPEGRVKFKVYPNPGHHQPWGVFTTAKGGGKCGPRYPASGPAEDVPFDCYNKVWCVGDPSWNAILLARLQFKPCAVEPTPL
ncbi:hypothetical protein BJ165DRAFT_1613590 [Panaeolus papilionaceus]|nr:hypothetical protein BJ165DRAFT_1613590 [Panaeolus papilionaceus]